MSKINKLDKVAFVAVVTALVTNPLSGQYILAFLDWGFQQIFIRGAYVNLVASAIVMLYIAYKTFKPTKVVLPEKGKAQNYIKT